MITVTAKQNKSGNRKMKFIIPLWCFCVGYKYNPPRKAMTPTINSSPLNELSAPIISIISAEIIPKQPAASITNDRDFLLTLFMPLSPKKFNMRWKATF